MEARLNEAKNELRRRQQVAQQAEMRKNDLVVYLAHDIKTPLTTRDLVLSLLDEAPDMPSPQRARYIGITLEKAYRLEQLIDEFFDITRFNLQTIRLDREPVNLPHMLAQMADEFYPMLAPQGKAARVDCEDGLTVDADPDKLARVLNNILKNAAAYSDPNTVVSISARREGNSVHIAVENQGKTIPKQSWTVFLKSFTVWTRRGRAIRAGPGLAWRSPRRSSKRTAGRFRCGAKRGQPYSRSSCLRTEHHSGGEGKWRPNLGKDVSRRAAMCLLAACLLLTVAAVVWAHTPADDGLPRMLYSKNVCLCGAATEPQCVNAALTSAFILRP